MSRQFGDVEVQASERVRRQALEWGAALVGFADLSGVAPPAHRAWPRAMSVAMALDPAALADVCDGPTVEYFAEYERVNRRLNELTEWISHLIGSLGHGAEPLPATIPEGREAVEWVETLSVSFQHKTAATRAGLGWIGKNALLVTPTLGPRARLATVLTDMPLVVGEPVTVSRCGKCRACARACPAGAIKGQDWQAGMARDILLDARLCYETASRLIRELVGAENAVCGVCVAVCPVGRS